jgi:hypothetical protein
MLRITMSVSGEEAAKYFDSALRTSDYYVSENGLWGGKGAERLGLVGDVTRGLHIAGVEQTAGNGRNAKSTNQGKA